MVPRMDLPPLQRNGRAQPHPAPKCAANTGVPRTRPSQPCPGSSPARAWLGLLPRHFSTKVPAVRPPANPRPRVAPNIGAYQRHASPTPAEAASTWAYKQLAVRAPAPRRGAQTGHPAGARSNIRHWHHSCRKSTDHTTCSSERATTPRHRGTFAGALNILTFPTGYIAATAQETLLQCYLGDRGAAQAALLADHHLEWKSAT